MKSIFLAVFCLSICASIAQVRDSSFQQLQDSSLSIFDYLVRDSVSEITLKTDMKRLKKNTFKEQYQPAEITFFTSDGIVDLSFEITVKTRGNMRKKVCYFPSLKLNFSKSDLKKSGFKPVDKYKLVCQCVGGKSAEQQLLKEYLAYKLYNIVTNNSFNVHLFTINYIDTKKKKNKKRYGFLIENENELAKRLNGEELEPDSVILKNVRRENILQMGIFQYMIGNTDYSMIHMHNLKAVRMKNSDSALLIPYDFDYSGLVDARYAVPNPEMPIRDVKDRWFNISGCNRKEVEKQIEVYLSKKDEILECTQNFTLLNKNSHYDASKYISDFFKIIENPREVKSQFVRK